METPSIDEWKYHIHSCAPGSRLNGKRCGSFSLEGNGIGAFPSAIRLSSNRVDFQLGIQRLDQVWIQSPLQNRVDRLAWPIEVFGFVCQEPHQPFRLWQTINDRVFQRVTSVSTLLPHPHHRGLLHVFDNVYMAQYRWFTYV